MTTPRGILKPITSPETSSPPDGQPALREVRFHEPGQGNAPNVAASYPTEVGHVSQSPISTRTEAGPSNVNQRRSREGTLTPIDEGDSQAAEERKKSTILGPAMNTFQRTTSPPVMHVTTSNAPIQAPVPTRDHDRSAPAQFPVIEARVPSPELSRKAPNTGKPRTPVRKSRFSEDFEAPSADVMFSNIPDAAPSSSLNAPPRLPQLPGAFDTPAMPPATVPAGSPKVPTQLPQLPGAFPSSSHSDTPNMKPPALEQLPALRDVANQSPKVFTIEQAEASIPETIQDRVDEARVGNHPHHDIAQDPQLETLPPRDTRHHLNIDEQLA